MFLMEVNRIIIYIWEYRYFVYFLSLIWCCLSNGKILKNLEKLDDNVLFLDVKIIVFLLVFFYIKLENYRFWKKFIKSKLYCSEKF